MAAPQRSLGFGTTKQTADFFGLTTTEVQNLTKNGQWRSWLIGGRRLFDLDEIVKQLAQDVETATTASEREVVDA